MIVGRWTPLGAFGAALLFASSQALGQIIKFAPPTRPLGDFLLGDPGPVLRRAALPRDDHRPGRLRRPEHPAGRRRPAVRARGARPDARGTRPRPRAYPGPPGGPRPGARARRRRDRARACARRAGSRSWAPRRPDRPSYGVFRFLLTRATSASRSTRTCASPRRARFRTLEEAVAATGPFDMVDVFRRPERAPACA